MMMIFAHQRCLVNVIFTAIVPRAVIVSVVIAHWTVLSKQTVSAMSKNACRWWTTTDNQAPAYAKAAAHRGRHLKNGFAMDHAPMLKSNVPRKTTITSEIVY